MLKKLSFLILLCKGVKFELSLEFPVLDDHLFRVFALRHNEYLARFRGMRIIRTWLVSQIHHMHGFLGQDIHRVGLQESPDGVLHVALNYCLDVVIQVLTQLLVPVPLIIGVDNELSKLFNAKRFAVGATHTVIILSIVHHFELGSNLDDTTEDVLEPPELAVPPLIEVWIVHPHFMLKEARKVFDGIPAD